MEIENKGIPVALFITELEPGGAERALTELACRLDSSVFLPIVYVLGRKPVNDLLVKQIERQKITIRYFNLPLENKIFLTLNLPRIVYQIRAALRQDRILLVQSFLFHANFLSRLAINRRHTPLISGYRVCEPRQGINFLDWVTRNRASAHTAVGKNVLDYYGLSDLSQNEMNSNSRTAPCLIIPNGVDGERFSPKNRCQRTAFLEKWNIPDDSIVLISAGRLTQQKGFELFLPEFAKWVHEFHHLYYLIAGEGHRRRALECLIEQNRLSDRVRLCGYVNNMEDFYGAGDIFLLPSLWEGVPNAAIEAAAVGLPVITFANSGLDVLYKNGGFNQCVPYTSCTAVDFKKYSDCVYRFLQNPTERQAAGEANRSKVLAAHNWDSMAEAYQRLWKSLLKK